MGLVCLFEKSAYAHLCIYGYWRSIYDRSKDSRATFLTDTSLSSQWYLKMVSIPMQNMWQRLCLPKVVCKFELSALVLVACLAFNLCAITRVDDDLWTHLHFGLDVLRTDFVTAYLHGLTGALSCTWHDHQWLSNFAFAAALLKGSWCSLNLLKLAIALATLLLTFWPYKRNKIDAVSKAAIFLAATVLIAPYFWAARPEVFSYLCLAIFVTIIRSVSMARRSSLSAYLPIFGLPFLFAVWANLDGAMISGLIAFLVWVIAETIACLGKHQQKMIGVFWLTIVASLAATSVNPYGLSLVPFLLNAIAKLGGRELTIGALDCLPNLEYPLVLALALLSIFRTKEKRVWSSLAVWAVFAVLPVVSSSYFPHFLVASLVLLSEHISDLKGVSRYNRVGPSRQEQRLILTAVPVLCTVLLTWGICCTTRDGHIPPKPEPTEIAALLRKISFKGNILCHWDWCEYLNLQFAKQGAIYYDRASEPGILNSLAKADATDQSATMDLLISKFKIDTVVTDKQGASYRVMKLKQGWVLAYEDDLSALFCPVTSPYLALMKNPDSIIHFLIISRARDVRDPLKSG